MATTGISRIDQLLASGGAAIASGDGPDAVGILQDLLIGHGFAGLPGILGAARGVFGPATTSAVRQVQEAAKLPLSGGVDQATLRAMIARRVTKPAASQGYLCLVLDVAFRGLTRVMSLTSQFEGGGMFGAINRNTDGAGLSYGLIQWAQKPRRLREILAGFQQQEPATFAAIFGNGDAALAQALITHTAKINGGVDAAGRTTDAKFDLVNEPWLTRFRNAALEPALQKVQVSVALAAFADTLAKVRSFAPQLVSERALAFMLDLANQHGDAGAESIFKAVSKPGIAQSALFLGMQNESVARVQKKFGPGNVTESTRRRREAFRTTPLLSDQPFQAA
ncbi:MAG TPA: peptidoglycan-binding domain-containing protein [Thermoanaerobaculia bacterium]|nr:peptidoglycan-binding domain-containing protein [Thermoanaerobaculia bacterium]